MPDHGWRRKIGRLERWDRQCQVDVCHSYIPDNARLCDHHLLEKYGLYEARHCDTLDYLGSRPMIEEVAVLWVVRELERKAEGGEGEAEREWWISGIARLTGNRSKCGPFRSPVKAAKHIEEYYPASDWKSVMLTSRATK